MSSPSLVKVNDVLDYVVKARDAGKLHSSWTRELLASELVEFVRSGRCAVCIVDGAIHGVIVWNTPNVKKKEVFVDNFVASSRSAAHALHLKIIELAQIPVNEGWVFTGVSRKTGRPRRVPVTTQNLKKI